MSNIDYFTPNREALKQVEQYRQAFEQKGITEDERVGFILKTFYANVETMKEKGIDFWLQFGVYLPAVERVIAVHNGESEQDFYRRTQYPKHIVEAYSLVRIDGEYDDFATLVVADWFKNQHLKIVPANTSVWKINHDGETIDLNLFENRLRGV